MASQRGRQGQLARLALLLALSGGVQDAAAQSSAGKPSPPQRNDRWFVQGQAAMQDRIEKLQRRRETRAKNVILFVADGYGITSNQATRLFAGQYDRAPSGVSATLAGADGAMVGADQSYGEEHILPNENMPNLALSKTYNTNAQTPDSAGTASALNTGVKTKSGVISVREGLRRGYCTDLGPNDAGYSVSGLEEAIVDTNLTETCAFLPSHHDAPFTHRAFVPPLPPHHAAAAAVLNDCQPVLQIRRDSEEGIWHESRRNYYCSGNACHTSVCVQPLC